LIVNAAKYICGAPLLDQPACVVHSFGSNGEAEFEKDFVRKAGCKVHVFDPTLDRHQQSMFDRMQGEI